jgi:Right handed beta helix region
MIEWIGILAADVSILLFPSFQRADPGDLVRHRWQLCSKAPAAVQVDFTATGGVIESIAAPESFDCAVDGTRASCTVSGLSGCEADLEIAVRASSDRAGGEVRITGRVAPGVEDDAATPVHRWLAVTSTADAGPGSLRDAFEQANRLCSPGPCRIVFEIPPPVPAEGWFTITPETPLPELTADRVRIEGSSQTKLTGHTNVRGPEIAIDGRLAGRGLKMLTGCEGVVEGLAIGNFGEDQGLWISTNTSSSPRCRGLNGTDYVSVSFNHLGVSPDGQLPWPNLRGLRADGMAGYVSANRIRFNRHSGVWMWEGGVQFANNWIEHNGAAGMFLGPGARVGTIGNRIAGNAQMGIAVAAGAPSIDLRRNSMKDNGGLGIDWELDGISPTDRDDRTGPANAPVILYGYYDAESNKTIVAVSIKSAPHGSGRGALNFYANDAADGDGETHIEQLFVKPDEVVLAAIAGDHRGKWINATWTRMFNSEYGPFQTSELSNALRIE